MMVELPPPSSTAPYSPGHMAKHKKRARSKNTSTEADKAKAEAKKERRLARQLEELEAKQRSRRVRQARNATIGALGIVALGVLLFVVFKPDPELAGVERPPNEGRTHVAQGQPVAYSTATPTSGTHSGSSSARCGVYSEPLPLELAVHALEHGAVIVWYSPDLADTERQNLATMVDRWDSHVIVSPNDGLTDPIVATAWNRLMRFDSAGEDVAEFIDVYRKRGPESVACDI